LGLDGAKLAETLNARNVPGIYFRPASWSPTSGFWAGQTLNGVELVIVNRHAYRAVRSAVEILVAVRKIAPSAISIRSAAALDKDWGTDSLRRGLVEGASVEDIMHPFVGGAKVFSSTRAPYLLYPEAGA
jgi:uncharacterized protein YbbC (DUF1343 family)